MADSGWTRPGVGSNMNVDEIKKVFDESLKSIQEKLDIIIKNTNDIKNSNTVNAPAIEEQTVTPEETKVEEAAPIVETAPVVETPAVEAPITPAEPEVQAPVVEEATVTDNMAATLSLFEQAAQGIQGETPVAEVTPVAPVAEAPVETAPAVETPAVEEAPIIPAEPEVQAPVAEVQAEEPVTLSNVTVDTLPEETKEEISEEIKPDHIIETQQNETNDLGESGVDIASIMSGSLDAAPVAPVVETAPVVEAPQAVAPIVEAPVVSSNYKILSKDSIGDNANIQNGAQRKIVESEEINNKLKGLNPAQTLVKAA